MGIGGSGDHDLKGFDEIFTVVFLLATKDFFKSVFLVELHEVETGVCGEGMESG